MLIEIIRAYRQHGGKMPDGTGSDYAEGAEHEQQYVEKAVIDQKIKWSDVWRLVFFRLMASGNKREILQNIRLARKVLSQWERSVEDDVGMTAEKMLGEDEENTP
jgi:hypothetical protein